LQPDGFYRIPRLLAWKKHVLRNRVSWDGRSGPDIARVDPIYLDDLKGGAVGNILRGDDQATVTVQIITIVPVCLPDQM
jgi:hypothetical protein